MKIQFLEDISLVGVRPVVVEAQADEDAGLAVPSELDVEFETFFPAGLVVGVVRADSGMVVLADGSVYRGVPAGVFMTVE